MPHSLFIMHGMGRHVPNWAESTVALLHSLPARYGYTWFDANGSLDEHLDPVPIDYDDVFDHYVQSWGKSAQALGAQAGSEGVDISGILGWLEGADKTEDNFFWTHVVDVVLYRFFSIVTAEVRLRVRSQIAAELARQGEGGGIVQASVLAHSLGTSVAHDSLALLGTQPIESEDGLNRSFMLENHRFANVFMCANVGRVLETHPKVYQSVVRPPGSGPSYVDAYFNFRHRYDPFPMVRAFGPVGWRPSRFKDRGDSEKVLQFNVHGLEHYLDDPRIHIPILRATVGEWSVTPAEELAAIAEYDAKDEPDCIGELVRFKSAALRIIELAKTGADPVALVIAGTQFLATAKEAYDACK